MLVLRFNSPANLYLNIPELNRIAKYNTGKETGETFSATKVFRR